MPTTDHLFGVIGLTPGGLGIWVLVAGLAAWWIRGMADRMRAANEGHSTDATIEESARALLFTQMKDQMTAMAAEIAALKKRVMDLEAAELEWKRERIELHAAIDPDRRGVKPVAVAPRKRAVSKGVLK